MSDVRLVLRDDQWVRMEPHCHGKASDSGRSGGDNRMFLEAVLWIARTGSPWRDLPVVFGKWNTVFNGLIADKAFDNNLLVADLNERGAAIVISQHPARASKLKIDTELYKWRHLIENFFCKLKEFKRIAMRADKTDHSFSAMIYLAAAVINSR